MKDHHNNIFSKVHAIILHMRFYPALEIFDVVFSILTLRFSM